MKRITAVIVGLLLCAGLAGCSEKEVPLPEKAADGAAWSKDWVTAGNLVGVDTPEDLRLLENLNALENSDMYYASWVAGEGTPYVDSEGNDILLYDAQLSLLLSQKDPEEIAPFLTELQGTVASQYDIGETWEETCNGLKFSVLTCTYPEGTNHYERGVSAFGSCGNYAVIVEFSSRKGYEGDLAAILTGFLNNCHWAA